jgi:hypothetical protein
MAYGKKYEGFGLGRNDQTKSIDQYYKVLLGMLDLNLCCEIMGSKEDGNSCKLLINPYFISFQEWCRDMYDEMKSDQTKAYFYFRDILVSYQLLKEDSFYEKGNNIYNSLLTKPISKMGDGIQQMAYVIHEYLNLAIKCLQDYVNQLTPSTIIENPPPPPPIPAKIRGFRIKNKDCLEIAFIRLRSLFIIQHDVRQKDIEDAFSGWIPKNKIIWLKGPGLLMYFIKSINGKGIEDEKKDIWITTINCFQDKDLKNFTIEQLRFAKKPSKTEDVDLVIKVINRNSGI